MQSIRYRQISRGVKALLNSAGTRAVLTEKAQSVLSSARAGAPVDSGAYRSSIHIEQDTTDRAVVRVVADAAHALIVEASTGNLARSLDGMNSAAKRKYTTKSGRTIMATQAQIDNWTRGF